MEEATTKRDAVRTVGLDLGDRWTVGFVIDEAGEAVERFRIRTTPEALAERFSTGERCRVILEVGTHSPWVSRLVEAAGHETIVANPRRVRLITQNDRKNDEVDAELLARIGRLDPSLLCPIHHRGETAQQDLIRLRARSGLVRARTQLINQVRGFAKSLGRRLPSCSSDAFARRIRSLGPEQPFAGCEPLLRMIEALSQEIRSSDRELERLSEERYPETRALRQIAGVGTLTALGFVLTLEDPDRFPNSRSVGAYLGLCPRQRDSGDRRPQLRITKAGDVLLRMFLVQAAHYILGPFGPDTDLRRFGLALAERGGKAAKKRAAVAVARRLAALLHRLWITQEDYEPLRHADRRAA